MAIASMPWYDLPETREFTDAFWRAVADQLRAGGVNLVPDSLERDLHHAEQWRHPSLMFTQACGYDVALDNGRFLRAVAAPCFLWPGCDAHYYRSFVVVREADRAAELPDMRGRRAVINNESSHSGANAFRAMMAPLSREGRFFSEVKVSGAHATSIEMLHKNEVDVACIDCVTWGLLGRFRPQVLQGLSVISQTPLAPAPPYVISMRYGRVFARKIQNALVKVMSNPDTAEVRSQLGIGAVALLDNSAYQRILDFEKVASEHDYFELPMPEGSALNRLRMRAR
jgi:ABC-type phosphate/phosphonate transport system substrate-binding protein